MRGALPLLATRGLGPFFFTYLTFSTMHLGLCYNVNRLVTAGVWLLKRVRDAPSLAQMALSDCTTSGTKLADNIDEKAAVKEDSSSPEKEALAASDDKPAEESSKE